MPTLVRWLGETRFDARKDLPHLAKLPFATAGQCAFDLENGRHNSCCAPTVRLLLAFGLTLLCGQHRPAVGTHTSQGLDRLRQRSDLGFQISQLGLVRQLGSLNSPYGHGGPLKTVSGCSQGRVRRGQNGDLDGPIRSLVNGARMLRFPKVSWLRLRPALLKACAETKALVDPACGTVLVS